jgi:AcrR family transcriptional regulator
MMQEQPDTDKRTLILNTMLDLIAEFGFHGTAMSMIAKRSGVSTGIIYHYFEGKDDLIQVLFRHVESQFSQALMLDDPHMMPFPDHLKQVWLNAFRFYITHPKETLFLEQYKNSPYFQFADSLDFDDNMRLLTKLVQEDFVAGYVREMPFEVFYELTLGVALGLAKHQIAGRTQLDDAMLEQIADSCCRAVEA